MRKEMKNHRMVSSSRNQVFSWTNALRNYEIVIGRKLLVSRRLMSLSRWRKKLKLRERNRKQLLLEDTTIVEDGFCIWFLMLWKSCQVLPLQLFINDFELPRPKGSSVITESRSRPPPPTQDELQVLLVLVARRKERCAESGWESTGTSRQARNACSRRRRADPWAVLCRAGPAGPAEAIMQSRCGLECQDSRISAGQVR
jgi:hypothetical protein